MCTDLSATIFLKRKANVVVPQQTVYAHQEVNTYLATGDASSSRICFFLRVIIINNLKPNPDVAELTVGLRREFVTLNPGWSQGEQPLFYTEWQWAQGEGQKNSSSEMPGGNVAEIIGAGQVVTKATWTITRAYWVFDGKAKESAF